MKGGIVPALVALLLFVSSASVQAQTVEQVASNLQNPRGVAVMPNGRLIVTQAGTGLSTGNADDYTGKLSVLDDLNGDGDFDDEGEVTHLLDKLVSYNILYLSEPGRDEVLGAGDVSVLPDERILFTLDDNFDNIAIVAYDPFTAEASDLYISDGSMNSLVYDTSSETLYIAESTTNIIGAIDASGNYQRVVAFGLLASNQQAVPAGLALDPTTGDLLVALFSGQLWVYYGTTLSFMPGDAKVVRIDLQTGEFADEITGLTTAVDVAVDEDGNVYVVEMTTQWATPMFSREFDLFDPDAPPDAGGYARFTGRVTLYPADDSDPIILADGLDQPTNITYHEGVLYVSVGQGTPNRPIWSPTEGLTHINGGIVKITLDG